MNERTEDSLADLLRSDKNKMRELTPVASMLKLRQIDIEMTSII